MLFDAEDVTQVINGVCSDLSNAFNIDDDINIPVLSDSFNSSFDSSFDSGNKHLIILLRSCSAAK